MNNGAIIIGIGFFIIAFLDGVGSQILIKKEYRESKNLREWQKKRVFIDVLIGIGSMTIYFSSQERNVVFFVGVIVTLIGFILLVVLDYNFKKSIKSPYK